MRITLLGRLLTSSLPMYGKTQLINTYTKMVDTFDYSGKRNVPFDPKWHGNQRRWKAHCTGNLYALTIQNRSLDHTFVVHQYGKNVFQAGLRYYRGFTNYPSKKRDSWIWQCTKIISANLLSR